MPRISVLLTVALCLGATTPSLAQSLEARGYYFNNVENTWKPLPAYELPTARDNIDFVKFLTLQEYHFNSVDNVWEPLAAPA